MVLLYIDMDLRNFLSLILDNPLNIKAEKKTCPDMKVMQYK